MLCFFFAHFPGVKQEACLFSRGHLSIYCSPWCIPARWQASAILGGGEPPAAGNGVQQARRLREGEAGRGYPQGKRKCSVCSEANVRINLDIVLPAAFNGPQAPRAIAGLGGLSACVASSLAVLISILLRTLRRICIYTVVDAIDRCS